MEAPFLASPSALIWLAAIPAMLLLWWRSPLIITAKGKVVLGALRVLVVALLVLVLADPKIPRKKVGLSQACARLVLHLRKTDSIRYLDRLLVCSRSLVQSSCVSKCVPFDC